MNNIKNLLFDLGGVIIDINRDRCVAAYTRAGMRDAEDMLGVYKQSGIFLLLEEGKVTPEEFRAEMRKHFDCPVSDDTIDNCFFQFLLGIPVERLRALERLAKQYHIYLLSNTNTIMFNSVIREFFRADGHDLEYYAEDMVLSYEAHCCKPDQRIFQMCIDQFGIRPEETLFFDDGQANCDAAQLLGFRTHCVKPGTEFYDYFK